MLLILISILCSCQLTAEDGYRLWLRYDRIENESVRADYLRAIRFVSVDGESPVLDAARKELSEGLAGLLGQSISQIPNKSDRGLYLGIVGKSDFLEPYISRSEMKSLKSDGFMIKATPDRILIAALDDKGLLYGAFHILKLLQLNKPLDGLSIVENPRISHRILNHWDNLDGTVERGYAGFSIWNWHQLPTYIDQRYIDYARANASIGINGTVVTNVNANALIFRADYLEKAAALADVFRPYGIKLYLTARFSAPMELGGLATADPEEEAVRAWWHRKVAEIYKVIPDFGGFLVKANSEGQPGPQDYGRDHASGANLLADAVAPFGGIVMWRAFVYSEEAPEDRAMQAYNEFVPLDGAFRPNVLIQVKNGPIDFQPREPVHPLFGAMPNTPLMLELQITKEYLGQGTHLVGLATMFREILDTDTFRDGKGTTVSKVVEGKSEGHNLSGIAGVANIGTARNWTGHHFGQADWYAFGQLAWDPGQSVETIYTDWAQMTFTHDPGAVQVIVNLLTRSYEACVNYMTPLGLHHIMGAGHHYGPAPWVDSQSRPDWNSVYYHKADTAGVGFDRTQTGSNALSQYAPGFRAQYEDATSCPPEVLLWFHHVRWDTVVSTGNTLWEELCLRYHTGASAVTDFKQQWHGIENSIDRERHKEVLMHLTIQEMEAKWWRDACLSYFQSFSKMEIPKKLGQPEYSLEYYQSLSFPYAPGIRPRW